MKRNLKLPLLLLLVAASTALPLGAQTTNAPAKGENLPPPPPPQGAPGQRGPMALLNDEERAKLKAAHDTAIQMDPSLEQAMKDAQQALQKARKAMNDAMIAADPSVEAILAKMNPPKPPGNAPGPNTARPVQGMAALTEGEREQLKAAHEKVKNDPAVIAAREAKKNAITPEARRAAEEALRKVSREAMIKADPSIAPILEKLHPVVAPPQVPSPSASASPEAMMPANP